MNGNRIYDPNPYEGYGDGWKRRDRIDNYCLRYECLVRIDNDYYSIYEENEQYKAKQ